MIYHQSMNNLKKINKQTITKYNDIQGYIDKQTMISQLWRTDRVIYLWIVNKNINFSTSDIVVNEGTISEIFLNKVTCRWMAKNEIVFNV